MNKRFRLHSDPWPVKTRLAATRDVAERRHSDVAATRDRSCDGGRLLARCAGFRTVHGRCSQSDSIAEVSERREACLARRGDPSPNKQV